MKHKHADVIHAWADGAEIQVKDGYGKWKTAHQPNWDYDCEYRIKLEYWKQELIDQAKAGKIIQFDHYYDGWQDSIMNSAPEKYKFGVASKDQYRIKPEAKKPVVRWLWAYQVTSGGYEQTEFLTQEEADVYPLVLIKLEWSRTEFPE